MAVSKSLDGCSEWAEFRPSASASPSDAHRSFGGEPNIRSPSIGLLKEEILQHRWKMILEELIYYR